MPVFLAIKAAPCAYYGNICNKQRPNVRINRHIASRPKPGCLEVPIIPDLASAGFSRMCLRCF